jgi:hypothetical protein
MKHRLETRVETDKDGQVIQLYCKECDSVLSEQFYNGSNAYQLLGIRDCSHYRWVFVGDFYLSPPQDPDVRRIIRESFGKVSTNGGKYFLMENK